MKKKYWLVVSALVSSMVFSLTSARKNILTAWIRPTKGKDSHLSYVLH